MVCFSMVWLVALTIILTNNKQKCFMQKNQSQQTYNTCQSGLSCMGVNQYKLEHQLKELLKKLLSPPAITINVMQMLQEFKGMTPWK